MCGHEAHGSCTAEFKDYARRPGQDAAGSTLNNEPISHHGALIHYKVETAIVIQKCMSEKAASQAGRSSTGTGTCAGMMCGRRNWPLEA